MKTCRDCGEVFGIPGTPLNHTIEESRSFSLHINVCRLRQDRLELELEFEFEQNEMYTSDITRLLDAGFTDEQAEVLLDIISEKVKP
ncbi:hypothetical protein LCGC14_1860000 [marine sediment metagenome]|uniref:Uncharacterized protein n=1 Tax=marine sediment metagenome TaxID=412755 RepID=A0A0F9G867_9ZZZZ